MRNLLVAAAVLGVPLALATSAHPQSRWSWPETPENLQVLPADTRGEELRPIMRGFTQALGVRCSHCHVGEEGQPLSTFDFASDENPNKGRAREMMRMLTGVEEHLARIEPSGGEAVDVGCDTCHRGIARPMRLSDLLRQTWQADGADAVLPRYQELRAQYYGRGAYDFGVPTLNAVGYAMLEAGEDHAALTVFAANTDLFPDSALAFDSLAEAHMKAGHTDQAIEFYEKSLALDPRNRNATRMLEQLRSEQ